MDRNSEDKILFSEIASFVDTCKASKNIYIIIPLSEKENTQIAIRCCSYYHRFYSRYTQYVELFLEMIKSIRTNSHDLIDVGNCSASGYEQDNLNVIVAMSKMINSPRMFFSFRRAAQAKWLKFKGEIDLYDFLVL